MKKKYLAIAWTGFLAVGLMTPMPLAADEAPIHIEKPLDMAGYTPPTPIAITGFSGEVAHVLNFDLTVMGFTNVPAASAQYVLSGENNPNVRGQLNYGKNVRFSKIYSGTSVRAQAHRLADDVVLSISGVNGIAETKIAYKRVTGSRSSEIYIADFDGFDAKPVTQDSTDAAAPCWVPGRMALYYTSYKLGSPNIFFQDLPTGQRHNFAHYPGLNSSAAVSPDGSKVAMILSKAAARTCMCATRTDPI
jgi:TolB protein